MYSSRSTLVTVDNDGIRDALIAYGVKKIFDKKGVKYTDSFKEFEKSCPKVSKRNLESMYKINQQKQKKNFKRLLKYSYTQFLSSSFVPCKIISSEGVNNIDYIEHYNLARIQKKWPVYTGISFIKKSCGIHFLNLNRWQKNSKIY